MGNEDYRTFVVETEIVRSSFKVVLACGYKSVVSLYTVTSKYFDRETNPEDIFVSRDQFYPFGNPIQYKVSKLDKFIFLRKKI